MKLTLKSTKYVFVCDTFAQAFKSLLVHVDRKNSGNTATQLLYILNDERLTKGDLYFEIGGTDAQYNHLILHVFRYQNILTNEVVIKILDKLFELSFIDPNTVFSNGSPLIFFAGQHTRKPVCEYLIEKGSRITDSDNLLLRKGLYGYSAFHYAHVEAMDVFVESCVRLDVTDPELLRIMKASYPQFTVEFIKTHPDQVYTETVVNEITDTSVTIRKGVATTACTTKTKTIVRVLHTTGLVLTEKTVTV